MSRWSAANTPASFFERLNVAFRTPEQYRVVHGPMATPRGLAGGCFLIPTFLHGGGMLRVIAHDGRDDTGRMPAHLLGWEHVSVSLQCRCPVWEEMCAVKAAFWEPEDAVLQIHPPESDYVNAHQFCLHLWRPVDGVVALPPSILVGFV